MEWKSKRSRIAVFIAYKTGMRMGEVRALRICDIHEDYIYVSYNWAKISKRKCTKNQESREIPILPEVYAEIRNYIKEMGLTKLNGLLLPGKNPEIPYNNRQIGKDFNKMLGMIGISELERKERGIVYHSWRHLLAKNLAQNSTNKAIAMKILGHKSSKVYDHYASHADKETFRKMIKAMETITQEESKNKTVPFQSIG